MSRQHHNAIEVPVLTVLSRTYCPELFLLPQLLIDNKAYLVAKKRLIVVCDTFSCWLTINAPVASWQGNGAPTYGLFPYAHLASGNPQYT